MAGIPSDQDEAVDHPAADPWHSASMAILTARDAADLIAPRLAGAADELLAVAYLDAAGRLLALEVDAEAGDSVALPIRAIVGRALALDARGLVVAHNHPSGDASPSVADITVTRRLALTCASIDIRLYDHLIFAGKDCTSFRLEGLL